MSGRETIGVVAALPEEIGPLRGRLEQRRRQRLAAGKVTRGVLAGAPVVTLATGDGSRRARHGLATLLDQTDLRALIVVGIAGGLSDDLGVGDVVVASRVTNGAGEVPAPDEVLLARARALPGVATGSIFSHSEVAVDPVAKERLWRQTGSRRHQVVDLESASYARVAAAKGVPYAVLRAVSDSADEALPLDFNRFRRADGSSDRLRVGRHAVLHPSIVPELMQLRERLHDCALRLADLVQEIVRP